MFQDLFPLFKIIGLVQCMVFTRQVKSLDPFIFSTVWTSSLNPPNWLELMELIIPLLAWLPSSSPLLDLAPLITPFISLDLDFFLDLTRSVGAFISAFHFMIVASPFLPPDPPTSSFSVWISFPGSNRLPFSVPFLKLDV